MNVNICYVYLTETDFIHNARGWDLLTELTRIDNAALNGFYPSVYPAEIVPKDSTVVGEPDWVYTAFRCLEFLGPGQLYGCSRAVPPDLCGHYFRGALARTGLVP